MDAGRPWMGVATLGTWAGDPSKVQNRVLMDRRGVQRKERLEGIGVGVGRGRGRGYGQGQGYGHWHFQREGRPWAERGGWRAGVKKAWVRRRRFDLHRWCGYPPLRIML